jgi:pimeloyl-ACP methyl ester carboxylesterase
MKIIFAVLFAVAMVRGATAQTGISFPTQDGGMVFADIYGSGDKAVVLAHGGQFNKESWSKQALVLVNAGYRVLAIDFRGYGNSHGPGDKDVQSAPLYQDVLAAVRYLRAGGAKWVAVVGGSMGGSAAGDASIESKPGAIDKIVMLGAAPNEPADKLHCPSLFLVAREDASGDGTELRLPAIQRQYDRAPQPKKLILVESSAHAQHLFETPQNDRVMREILDFLRGN